MSQSVGMRAVVQRVERASVTVAGKVVGAIDRGFCVFVGVTHDDGPADVEVLSSKLAGLRVFGDEQGAMNLPLADVDGSILLVSQFTLYGDVARGRRPSFAAAADPAVAGPLFDGLVTSLRRSGCRVETGVFRARMSVEIVNDGPVTILLETSKGRLLPVSRVAAD